MNDYKKFARNMSRLARLLILEMACSYRNSYAYRYIPINLLNTLIVIAFRFRPCLHLLPVKGDHPGRASLPHQGCSNITVTDKNNNRLNQKKGEEEGKNEDDTGADEFASKDEDIRMDVSAVSQIGVSGVTQSPLRNKNNYSLLPPSSLVARTATARRPPLFQMVCQSIQSWVQQFRINEILSLLESFSTHLPIGLHEW